MNLITVITTTVYLRKKLATCRLQHSSDVPYLKHMHLFLPAAFNLYLIQLAPFSHDSPFLSLVRSQVVFLFVVTQGQKGRRGKSKLCDGGEPGTLGLKGETVSVTHYWGETFCPILAINPTVLMVAFNMLLNYQN